MAESLVFLRVIGGFFGAILVLWTFGRFRKHIIRRGEFLLMSLLGASLIILVIVPNSINIVAGMLSLEDKQFGRLITLLIFSNFALWILVIGLRSNDAKKSIQFDLLVRRLARQRFLAAQHSEKIKEIVVIIPALDEGESLNQILPSMPEVVDGHPLSVLVVDDGSRDDTVTVTKKHGHLVVSNPINRGGGAALRLGYDIAMAGGAGIVVTMDGDGQHLPEEIERLVRPILRNEADFVIGSRVLGVHQKDSFVRWLGIHIFNLIINTLAGTRITDCSNGFRAFRIESLRNVLLLQDQFHAAELIIDAARRGIRIGEVPVTVLRRFSGQSKKGKNWRYGLNFSKTVMKTWLRK
ncbi:MAG: glycosyltransferase [Nitrospirales bacterium]